MLICVRSLNSCPAYEDGRLYGMDASSAAAVAALGVKPGDNVLDLCAAPGMKFTLLADVMLRQGTLTGVDVSTVSCATPQSTFVLSRWDCMRL